MLLFGGLWGLLRSYSPFFDRNRLMYGLIESLLIPSWLWAAITDHMEGTPGGLGLCFDVLYGIQIIGTFAFPSSRIAPFLSIPPTCTVGQYTIVTVEAALVYFAGGEIMRIKVTVPGADLAAASDAGSHQYRRFLPLKPCLREPPFWKPSRWKPSLW